MTVTKEEREAVLNVCVTIANTIRELGSVPSGHLYAAILPALPALTAHSYEAIIQTLELGQLVERRGHVLRWIGPSAGTHDRTL